jgi:hypothetical protein
MSLSHTLWLYEKEEEERKKETLQLFVAILFPCT